MTPDRTLSGATRRRVGQGERKPWRSGGARDTLRLALYLSAVLAATLVHEPGVLAGGLGIALVCCGRMRGVLLRKAFFAVLPVNLMISAGLVLAGGLAGSIDGNALLLLNLRVLLLSLLVAWTVHAVDFDRVLARWPAARRWLAIVRIHIGLLQRQASDYRIAFASRSAEPPTLATRYRAVAAHGLGLLDKAVQNAEATTLAMRSRGALDD